MKAYSENEFKKNMKGLSGEVAMSYGLREVTQYWDGRRFQPRTPLIFPVQDSFKHYQDAVSWINKTVDDSDEPVVIMIFKPGTPETDWKHFY